MKTLRKIDLDSMRSEMPVLMREEEKSMVGGSKIKYYDDPNDVPDYIKDEASKYVDDSGNYWPEGVGTGSMWNGESYSSEIGSGSSGTNDDSGTDTPKYDTKDCWWRCMAYLQSCGADYSAEAARALAKDYWGDDYSDAYYRMHAADDTQLALMCKEYLSNSDFSCRGTIMYFDPSLVPGWEGDGTLHAVVLKAQDGNYCTIFDPQSNRSAMIITPDLIKLANENKLFYVNN